MTKSPLSLLFLAAPAFANTLRGATAPLPEERSLQGDQLEANQIAFVVEYKMLLNPEAPERSPLAREHEDFIPAVHNWLINEVIEPVLAEPVPDRAGGNTLFALDTTWEDGGCLSTILRAESQPTRHSYKTVIQYRCEFEFVDSPEPQQFLALLKAQAEEQSNGGLSNAIVGTGSDLFMYLSTVTTADPASSTTWAQTLSSGRKVKDKDFVLPYDITWSFLTPRQMAGQEDYDATLDATKTWIENYWDVLYPDTPGADLVRRTVDVYPRLSALSPMPGLYQQSVTLGVDILIGADNITHVPSVTYHLAQMQFGYKVSNFTEILLDVLPEDSIFRESTRTSFAVVPTYPVQELQEAKNRTSADAIAHDASQAAFSTSLIQLGL